MSDQEKDRETSPEKPVHQAIGLEFPNGEELLDCDELHRQAEKARKLLDEEGK